jgi:hypothetical protein
MISLRSTLSPTAPQVLPQATHKNTQRGGGSFKLNSEFVQLVHSSPENYSLWKNYVIDPLADLYSNVVVQGWVKQHLTAPTKPVRDPNIQIMEMSRRGSDQVITPFKSAEEYQKAFQTFLSSHQGKQPLNHDEVLQEFHQANYEYVPVYNKITTIERTQNDGSKIITNNAVKRTLLNPNYPSLVERDLEEEQLVDKVYKQGIKSMTNDFPEMLRPLTTKQRLTQLVHQDANAQAKTSKAPFIVYTPPIVDGIPADDEIIL